MLSHATYAAADVAGGVLIVAGAAKLRDPRSFAGFLTTLGLRVGRQRGELVARLVGTVEIALALAVVLVGGALWFTAVGLLYLALAAVSGLAVMRGAPSCGCFGAASAATAPAQVVLDLVFALGSIGAALGAAVPLVDRLVGADGVAYLLLVGLATMLAVVTMTTAADLAAARRSLTTVGVRPGSGRG